MMRDDPDRQTDVPAGSRQQFDHHPILHVLRRGDQGPDGPAALFLLQMSLDGAHQEALPGGQLWKPARLGPRRASSTWYFWGLEDLKKTGRRQAGRSANTRWRDAVN